MTESNSAPASTADHPTVAGNSFYASIDTHQARSESPAFFDTFTEGSRAWLELMFLGASWPRLVSALGRRRTVQPNDIPSDRVDGAGQPVLVLPGFMGGDASTAMLRRYLNECGFQANPWLLGINNGSQALQSELLRRFLRLRARYQQPVALVGHSLGGVFAREIARQFPEDVKSVVTLGSPFGVTDVASINRLVRSLFEQMSGQTVEERRIELLRSDPLEPVGVPCTAIYSRRDGVVHWRSCLERKASVTENIEVFGSHCGLVVNPVVLQLVSDRLLQGAENWQPFEGQQKWAQCWLPKQKGLYAEQALPAAGEWPKEAMA